MSGATTSECHEFPTAQLITYSENIKMLRKLCGEECMRNMVLVTTTWSLLPSIAEGQERLRDLCEHPLFWRPLIQRGAQVAQYQDSTQSALDIVKLLDDHIPTPLQIQREMVERKLNLADTAAGIAVDGDLERMSREHRQAVLELRRERQRNQRDGDANADAREIGNAELDMHKLEHAKALERRKALKRSLWKRLGDSVLSALTFNLK